MSRLARIGLVCLSCVFVDSIGQSGPSTPCYFLQRDGCSGGGGFCQEGQQTCDIGYSQSDNGCGNTIPLQSGFERKCYAIRGNTLTIDCGSTVPAGWTQVGCSSNGVCCYTDDLKELSGDHGTMAKPQGAACGC